MSILLFAIIFEGISTSVTPLDYTCTPGQIHILCQCCSQPMPNSWPDEMTGRIPAQKCKCSFTLLTKFPGHLVIPITHWHLDTAINYNHT